MMMMMMMTNNTSELSQTSHSHRPWGLGAARWAYCLPVYILPNHCRYRLASSSSCCSAAGGRKRIEYCTDHEVGYDVSPTYILAKNSSTVPGRRDVSQTPFASDHHATKTSSNLSALQPPHPSLLSHTHTHPARPFILP